MTAVSEGVIANQSHISFMHQRGGIEGVAWGLAGHFRGGQLPQLVIDERQQIGGGLAVTLLGGFNQTGQIRHSCQVYTPLNGPSLHNDGLPNTLCPDGVSAARCTCAERSANAASWRQKKVRSRTSGFLSATSLIQPENKSKYCAGPVTFRANGRLSPPNRSIAGNRLPDQAVRPIVAAAATKRGFPNPFYQGTFWRIP
jgi:hypothetical protein